MRRFFVATATMLWICVVCPAADKAKVPASKPKASASKTKPVVQRTKKPAGKAKAAVRKPTKAASKARTYDPYWRADRMKRAAICVRTRKPPVLDGKLDDAAWKQAVPLGDFTQRGMKGTAARARTTVRLLYDQKNLYVAVEARGAGPVKKIRPPHPRDAGWPAGDGMEIFLTPPDSERLHYMPWRGGYLQIAFTQLGDTVDAIGECLQRGRRNWLREDRWQVRVRRAPGKWTAELRIPHAILGTAPKPDDVWEANFCRIATGVGPRAELSTFSPVQRRFHSRVRFGRILFLGARRDLNGDAQDTFHGISARTLTHTLARWAAQLEARVSSPAAAELARSLRALHDRARLIVRSAKKQDDRKVHRKLQALGAEATPLILRARLTVEAIGAEDSAPSALSLYTTSPATGRRVLPHYLPHGSNPLKTLSGVAARDEFEPMTFAIYAGRDLRNVAARIGNWRLNHRKPAAPAPSVDIRVVKAMFRTDAGYENSRLNWLVGEALLHDESLVRVDLANGRNFLRLRKPKGGRREVDVTVPAWGGVHFTRKDIDDADRLVPFSIPGGQLREIWMTVHVPKDAAAGVYETTLTVSADGAGPVQVPFRFEVLPFVLPESDKKFGTFWRSVFPYKGRQKYGVETDPRLIAVELAHLRDMGILYPVTYQQLPYEPERLGDWAALRKRLGLADYPHITIGPRGDTDAATAARYVRYARELGLREIWFYGPDEPSGENYLTKLVGRYRRGPRAVGGRSINAIHADYVGKYFHDNLDVMISAGYPTREDLARAHGHGNEVWVYATPQAGSHEPIEYRLNFGFGLVVSGADGVCTWAWDSGTGTGSPAMKAWNSHESGAKAVARPDYQLVLPERDGWIDMPVGIAHREAVDDTRYVTKLRQLIATAQLAGSRKAAAEAERLDAKLANLNIHRDLNVVRREIVAGIVRLQDMLSGKQPAAAGAKASTAR